MRTNTFPNITLKEAAVIRRMYKHPDITQRDLALIFCTNQKVIINILNNENWTPSISKAAWNKKLKENWAKVEMTGVNNINAKLNPEKVRKIRYMYRTVPNMSHRKLAKLFKVSRKTIFLILHNKIWKEVI